MVGDQNEGTLFPLSDPVGNGERLRETEVAGHINKRRLKVMPGQIAMDLDMPPAITREVPDLNSQQGHPSLQ